MTNDSINALLNQIESGNLKKDKEKVASYLQRCKLATTKQVAAYLGKITNTTSARLDDLAKIGLVIKTETKAGKTAWQWVEGEEERNLARHRYESEMAVRDINRLIKRNGKFLSSNMVNKLKLRANEIERAMVA